jgi:S1-C subfamily serine protease
VSGLVGSDLGCGISQLDKTKIPGRALLVAVGLGFTPVPPLQAETFTGTAFAVSEDGDLVTNEHVISGCSGGHYGESLIVR